MSATQKPQNTKVIEKKQAFQAAIKTRTANKEKLRQKAKSNIDKLLKKGKRPSTTKVWTNVQFRRPRTLSLPKNPKYARTSVPKVKALDKFQILKYPVTTDERNQKVESDNTITFVVNRKASKNQIKRAFKDMYQTKVDSVRTLITATGEKKAFIKLDKSIEAMDVATKIGIC